MHTSHLTNLLRMCTLLEDASCMQTELHFLVHKFVVCINFLSTYGHHVWPIPENLTYKLQVLVIHLYLQIVTNEYALLTLVSNTKYGN